MNIAFKDYREKKKDGVNSSQPERETKFIQNLLQTLVTLCVWSIENNNQRIETRKTHFQINI